MAEAGVRVPPHGSSDVEGHGPVNTADRQGLIQSPAREGPRPVNVHVVRRCQDKSDGSFVLRGVPTTADVLIAVYDGEDYFLEVELLPAGFEEVNLGVIDID